MDNRRMQNLRRKTQNYNFKIQHIPGAHIGATDGISRKTPQGDHIPDKEWLEINKLEVTDTQEYPGGWYFNNIHALTMSRYVDIKPGGEKAADSAELQQWCGMFSKTKTDQDREWIDKLVEDIDSDLDRCFDTRHWPGELESLGSLGEMISIDVGQMPNGVNFLCIADRFSGYVWAKQLKGAGESNQIIRVIMDSLGGLFLGLRRINSDNASNFVSYEFVN